MPKKTPAITDQYNMRKSEAIIISDPQEGVTYTEVMNKVMTEVSPQDIGVEVKRTRRTRAGAILLEVGDKEAADLLAGHLRGAIGDRAKVSRPRRMVKVLVINVADWLEEERITSDIRAADPELTDAKISIRENIGGGRIALVDTPMTVAAKLAESGSIRVGLEKCRIKLIGGRHPRCYRCQEQGHFAGNCPATEPVKRCYRCNLVGHIAKDCQRKPGETPTTCGSADSAACATQTPTGSATKSGELASAKRTQSDD